MKRMLLTAATSSLLAIAAPGVAVAHNGKHHHRSHHARRAHHARVIVFGAATPSGSTVTGTPTGAPQTPATPTPAGETAGTVASFTGGVLTITMTDGSTVSGKVTERTEIHCQSATPNSSGDDQGSGDDSGSEDGSVPPSQGETTMHSSNDGQSNDGQSNDGQGGEGQQSCTSAALVPGAVVREAELSVGSGGAIWDHIDLIQ